jgi:hypothetical protein
VRFKRAALYPFGRDRGTLPPGEAMPFSLGYLLQQANIGQSRSSVLNPLQWTVVILVFGIGVSLGVHQEGGVNT